MGKTLYNGSEEATEKTNTADVTTGILEIQPNDGLMFEIVAMAIGGAVGLPIYWDPKQGAASDLPLDTELFLQYQEAGSDDWVTVSEPVDNIQPWRARSVADQQDEDVVGSVVVGLKGAQINVRDVDLFRVAINSSATISWSDSTGLFFDERTVTEKSL